MVKRDRLIQNRRMPSRRSSPEVSVERVDAKGELGYRVELPHKSTAVVRASTMLS